MTGEIRDVAEKDALHVTADADIREKLKKKICSCLPNNIFFFATGSLPKRHGPFSLAK